MQNHLKWFDIRVVRVWHYRVQAHSKMEAEERLSHYIAGEGFAAENYNQTQFPRAPLENVEEIPYSNSQSR